MEEISSMASTGAAGVLDWVKETPEGILSEGMSSMMVTTA